MKMQIWESTQSVELMMKVQIFDEDADHNGDLSNAVSTS